MNKAIDANEIRQIQSLLDKAHHYAVADPEVSLGQARKAAEAIARAVVRQEIGDPGKIMLDALLQKLAAAGVVPPGVLVPFGTIQAYGNYGAHAQADARAAQAGYVAPAISAIDEVARWFYAEYLGTDPPRELGKSSIAASRRSASPRVAARPKRACIRGVAAAVVILVAVAAVVGLKHWKPSRPAQLAAAPMAVTSPPADANLVGPMLLTWSAERLDPVNLTFEVSLFPEAKQPQVLKTGRCSEPLPDGMEGRIRWKVRPIWTDALGQRRQGAWTPEQAFTWYPNVLRRLLSTRRLHLGIAEPDGIFIRQEGAQLEGEEIDLLRSVVGRILRDHGINELPTITYTMSIWGPGYFELLKKDGSVDLLASAISIRSEREEEFGLSFTNPTFIYPQSMIAKSGATVFSGGRLVLKRIGVVGETTNSDLAERLVPRDDASRIRTFSGSGAYDRMLGELAAEQLDGVLMDKPYALQKIRQYSQAHGVKWSAFDITSVQVPGLEPERVGFALRKTDHALLQAINERLPESQGRR